MKKRIRIKQLLQTGVILAASLFCFDSFAYAAASAQDTSVQVHSVVEAESEAQENQADPVQSKGGTANEEVQEKKETPDRSMPAPAEQTVRAISRENRTETDVKNGLIEENGSWHYYENGNMIQDTFRIVRGKAYGKEAWWLIRKGTLDRAYTALAEVKGALRYVEQGEADVAYTGMAYHPAKDAWWYVKDGKVDTGYTGLGYYPLHDTWWYVKNGRLDFGYSGLVEYQGNTWYIRGGHLDFGYTGLTVWNNQRVYIEGGRFHPEYTGMAYQIQDDSWWYVKDGKVDTGYTGLGYYPLHDTWWYVKNSRLDFGYSGLAEYQGNTWYISGGHLDFGYTGLTVWNNQRVYIEGGRFNPEYTGMAYQMQEDAWWYVKNGKVDTGYTGLGYYPLHDTWWYVKNGRLDFGYSGLTEYQGNTWYVRNGYLDFSFTGKAVSDKSWRYIQNGRFDASFNGTIQLGGRSYQVHDGIIRAFYPKAVETLNQIGWDLRSAFDWSLGITYYGHNNGMPETPDPGTQWYADFGFNNKKGNCYVKAATFYEMAAELGYEVRHMTGSVPYRRGGLGPHSWDEVKIDGTWYVFDPSIRKGYQIYYGQSGTWRYSNYYCMSQE